MPRKVCIVVHSRANYGRIKTVIRATEEHPDLELQLIVGSSALLHRFGPAIDVIHADGFREAAIVHTNIEGDSPTTMAKSTGLCITEMATQFEILKPDVVVTVADRYETLATAVAASYMNIPLAHTQGGEVTGSLDESVRHAITKLAHLHFPATERSVEFILRMGEDPSTVFLTGCPAIDIVAETDHTLPADIFKGRGTGAPLSPDKDYILVLQHPVTTEYGSAFGQINETIQAVMPLAQQGLQVVWLWPNVDAGSDDVSRGIRLFREHNAMPNISFFKNFSPEDYVRVLANARCIVGNSSSGLREGAYLGTPCVNVGTRQHGRERAANVMDAGYNSAAIRQAIDSQIAHGRYASSDIVGNGTAGKQIAEILATFTPRIQKTIHYIHESSGSNRGPLGRPDAP
jgi:UDP-hydrolysing UDP-N-acetyl-D-glucosamine 2-epimerase